MKMFAVLFLMMLSLSLFPIGARGVDPSVGSIHGLILDMNNQPVFAATVTIRELSGDHQGSRLTITTDQRGEFEAANLAAAKYLVIATKDETGKENPRAFAAFNHEFIVVCAGHGFPDAAVVLRLGSKTGVIRGQVRDAIDGSPVTATISVTLANSGNRWVTATFPADYRIPVPADTAMSMVVSAVGYKPWHYTNSANQSPSSVISLPRADQKSIEVPLQPISN